MPPFTELEAIEAMGLAWARVAPTVALVPAFGLRALPVSARAVVGLGLAAAIAPAVAAMPALGAGGESLPWALRALAEIARGLPVAVAAAVPLWAATMAGGLVDALRGAGDGQGLAVVEDRPSSFGVLLSLLASTIFLGTGGPARIAAALAADGHGTHGAAGGVAVPALLAAADDLAAGASVAVAIAAPLLAAAVVLELAFALVARAASPAQVHALLAPLRAVGMLAITAVVLDRIATLLAIGVRGAP
jgi:type III secretory pathway component EscT